MVTNIAEVTDAVTKMATKNKYLVGYCEVKHVDY